MSEAEPIGDIQNYLEAFNTKVCKLSHNLYYTKILEIWGSDKLQKNIFVY